MKIKVVMIHVLRNYDLRDVLNFRMQILCMRFRNESIFLTMYDHDRAGYLFHQFEIVEFLSNHDLDKPPHHIVNNILYRFEWRHKSEHGRLSYRGNISSRATSNWSAKNYHIFFIKSVFLCEEIVYSYGIFINLLFSWFFCSVNSIAGILNC